MRSQPLTALRAFCLLCLLCPCAPWRHIHPLVPIVAFVLTPFQLLGTLLPSVAGKLPSNPPRLHPGPDVLSLWKGLSSEKDKFFKVQTRATFVKEEKWHKSLYISVLLTDSRWQRQINLTQSRYIQEYCWRCCGALCCWGWPSIVMSFVLSDSSCKHKELLPKDNKTNSGLIRTETTHTEKVGPQSITVLQMWCVCVFQMCVTWTSRTRRDTHPSCWPH